MDNSSKRNDATIHYLKLYMFSCFANITVDGLSVNAIRFVLAVLII